MWQVAYELGNADLDRIIDVKLKKAKPISFGIQTPEWIERKKGIVLLMQEKCSQKLHLTVWQNMSGMNSKTKS